MMRVDHVAYQRAARVASLGFLLQAGVGLTLLIFGIRSQDTPLLFGCTYVLAGLLPWLSLILVFFQHAQERLEALEQDEISASRSRTGSAFDPADEEIRVAARRLRLMYSWLMPAVSLILTAALGSLAWLLVRYMGHLDDVGADAAETATAFHLTDAPGWAVAIALSLAAVSFIFSRFVAGMAKQVAWQNLRGGAAYMVGNALVLLAIAVGIIFRFFENDAVIEYIAWGIAVFMFVLAAEIIFNFILNLYRPRLPGETPRPAFDSRILSFFAAPDNIVRSINEAINYQFGFDITSSWGYQLLLRSFVWLVGLGVVVFVLLNTMVVVEPHQQAVKLAGGGIVGGVHGSGILWKLPWPFQSADVYDVSRVRDLHLTAKRRPQFAAGPSGMVEVDLWGSDNLSTDVEIEPFIVRSARVAVPENEFGSFEAASLLENDAATSSPDAQAPAEAPPARREVGDLFSLVDAELILRYRIRQTDDGLLDYVAFVPDTVLRRQRNTMRELAMKNLALSVISRRLATMTLDEVVSVGRESLAVDLRADVQATFDARRAGVEVLAISIPMMRPSGRAVDSFEEVATAHQVRLQRIAEAERDVSIGRTYLLGDPGLDHEILREIDRYNELRAQDGPEATQALLEQQARVERLLFEGGGAVAQTILEAEKDRWVKLMATRAEAGRVRGEVLKFRAAPELYRQREIMNALMNTMARVRKYVIAVDPSRVRFDVDLQELNPIFDFSQSLPESEGASGQ